MRPWLLVGLMTAGCAVRVAEPLDSAEPVDPAAVGGLFDVYAATCAGPEGVDDCSPQQFERTFARELSAIRRHRSELVAHWMDAICAGHHTAAYGLAWANVREALPCLREALLADRYFYGWESSDAHELAARMRDDQYPRHMARILAIERLSGRPVAEAVALTPDERARLVRESSQDAEPGGAPDVARWLLGKLAPELGAEPVADPAPDVPGSAPSRVSR
jgi:hypothetical protein